MRIQYHFLAKKSCEDFFAFFSAKIWVHFISSPGQSPGRSYCTTPRVGVGVGVGVNIKVFLYNGQGAVRRAILSLWQVLFYVY